jgi:chaperonin GroES
MKHVEPLDDRVVIRPTDAAKKTKGGIILPDNAREKPTEGTVVAVGEGKRGENGERMKLAVKVGDLVIYSKYAGAEIRIEDVEHVLLRETDCLAKITDRAPAQAESAPRLSAV